MSTIKERNHHSSNVKEVLLVAYEGKDRVLCEDLYEMTNQTSLLLKATWSFAFVAYSAKAMV